MSACVLGLSGAKILQISDNSGRPITASGLSFWVLHINSNTRRHCWFHLLFHYRQWWRGAPSQWPWVWQHNCFDWFCLALGLTKQYKFPPCTSFPVSTLPLTPLPPQWRELLLSPSGDVQGTFLFFLLSPFLLRGIGPGNSLMSQLIHLCASWFVSIFSLRCGSQRHLFSWGERHSTSLPCSWSVMVGHLPQSEVPPHQLSAVRNHSICNPSQDNSATISYLPPLQCHFVSWGDYDRRCFCLSPCPVLVIHFVQNTSLSCPSWPGKEKKKGQKDELVTWNRDNLVSGRN